MRDEREPSRYSLRASEFLGVGSRISSGDKIAGEAAVSMQAGLVLRTPRLMNTD